MRIGIDLGGTKIAGCALSEDGKEILRRRVATPKGDYAGTVAAIAALVESIEKDIATSCTVGIGYPGSVSPKHGTHRNANSTCLNGQDLIGDLSVKLSREIRGANDGNCLALSEAFDGEGRDARVVFAVIIGTGIGGGVVVDKRILVGHNAIAGEWGHCPMPGTDRAERRARRCYCGQDGCIEQFLAGPSLEAEYFRHSNEHRSLDEIVARSENEIDPIAHSIINSLCQRFADALAVVVNTIDPDVIVVGGGVSNVKAIFERTPALVAAQIFSDHFDTPIVQAQFGDASGVRGAARLWDARS
ncbi:MAG: ROK family protein [Planctomycetota bacterium]|nr:ROK family protein [Planctomycetota bacterium]MDA1262156.1 ROK family protein [Planctomycetota bacterium]